MSKVYALITHMVSDSEDLGINVQLFVDENSAKAALKAWRDDEMDHVEDLISKDTPDYHIVCDEPYKFEACDSGWYAVEHSIGYIEELEIN